MLQDETPVKFIPPDSKDGFAVNQLIAQSPPLDPNSIYCNLLQCSHFSETCICAKSGSKLLGFTSGYRIPTRPDTLFIWQIAVDSSARGKGLASQMLNALLSRPGCAKVNFLETTITPNNQASTKLFQKFASEKGTSIKISEAFTQEQHFNGQHETELLHRIGPLT